MKIEDDSEQRAVVIKRRLRTKPLISCTYAEMAPTTDVDVDRGLGGLTRQGLREQLLRTISIPTNAVHHHVWLSRSLSQNGMTGTNNKDANDMCLCTY